MSIDKKSWIKIIGMFLLFSAILIIDAVYVKNREFEFRLIALRFTQDAHTVH